MTHLPSLTRQRLLAALALSAGLHALLAALAERAPAAHSSAPAPALLQVRLERAQGAKGTAAQDQAAAAPRDGATAAHSAPSDGRVTGAHGAVSPAASGAGPAAAGVALDGIGVPVGAGERLDHLGEVQLRIATAVPPPVRLDYQVSGARTGSASLQWQPAEDGSYRLIIEQGGGDSGSTGVIADSGIAPLEAWSAHGANGRPARLRFDRAAGVLESSATPQRYRIIDPVQDSWSILMQLAAVGLANPERLRAPIVFFVAGAEGTATVRFEPAGAAVVQSALGAIEAEHLVQAAPPGTPRLEVWLAPQRDYLPVQLRQVRADGSALTHTVVRITPAESTAPSAP